MAAERAIANRSRVWVARAVIGAALAVAVTGTVLWAFGHLGLLAPILAGASAVVAVVAGALTKRRG